MTNYLEGELVRLRSPELEDRPLIHPWLHDPDVMRFNDVRYPISLGAMRDRPLVPTGYQLAHFAVVSCHTGERVGEVSLRTNAPENRGAELATVIGPAFRGFGYGTEALWLACRFGFDMMNLHRIELEVLGSNERAAALYERLGFKLEGRRRKAHFFGGVYEDWVVMSMLRHEFPGARPRVVRTSERS